MATNSAPNGSNGFIANLGGFFSDLGSTALDAFGQLLPIWAADQLGLQSGDQMDNSTQQIPPQFFNNPYLTTQPGQAPPSNLQGQNGFNISTNQIMLLGGGVLLGLILLNSN